MIVCIWLEVLPEIRWLEVTRDRSSAIFARKLVYTETTSNVWTFEIPTHVDVFQDDSCSNKMIRQERLVILIGERLCWSWNTKRLAEQSSDWAVNTFGCLLVSSLVSLYCRLYQVKVKYYRLFQFCASLWSLIPRHKFTLDLEQPRSSAKRSDHHSSCNTLRCFSSHAEPTSLRIAVFRIVQIISMSSCTMAESPQTSTSFFDLPFEIRKIIYEHFFKAVHVVVHDMKTVHKARPNPKPIATSSYCNLLLTTKKVHQEAKPHFLSNATFYLLPGCGGNVIHPLLLSAMGIHHLTFSLADPESRQLRESSMRLIEAVRGLVTHTGKAPALQIDRSAKLKTITYPWSTETKWLVQYDGMSNS